MREIVGVTGRTEADVIETSDIFSFHEGKLQRAGGYPPHADRFQQAGFDLSQLLQSESRHPSRPGA
ncbi:MAG TPA: hypothetical protein VHO01_05465 [Jatrophihabitans sp.]|nr:hypothetical protein [Jatrophihabitans sp.]